MMNFQGMNEHAIYDFVGAKRQRPSTEGLRRQWRIELVDLMVRMWAHDPAERPVMDEVVAELEEIFNRL
jgi:mitogen-activated protein kinase kinase kinase 13